MFNKFTNPLAQGLAINNQRILPAQGGVAPGGFKPQMRRPQKGTPIQPGIKGGPMRVPPGFGNRFSGIR